jgi:hypothetical protein
MILGQPTALALGADIPTAAATSEKPPPYEARARARESYVSK